MTNENHTILGGKVHLFRRNGGEKWHCYTFLKGKKRRKTTKPDSLSLAKEIAGRQAARRELATPHSVIIAIPTQAQASGTRENTSQPASVAKAIWK